MAGRPNVVVSDGPLNEWSDKPAAQRWGGSRRRGGSPRAARFMDYCGHRTVAMVRAYTRRSDAFADHAGEGLL